MKALIITYRDGKTETVYVDSYGVKDGCLYTHVRFGVDSGTRHIPLDRIKEYKSISCRK